jgi:cation diffusion facilitator CzcD-associated flavoprotein CzcO
MSTTDENHRPDVVVVGAGISGLVTAKCLKDSGFNVVVLERSGDIGGLWTFRENDYGVMRFTHMLVPHICTYQSCRDTHFLLKETEIYVYVYAMLLVQDVSYRRKKDL